MNNLKARLLSSIELYGKCDIYGLLNLYPGFTKRQILRQLFTLRNEGWIKINKHRVIEVFVHITLMYLGQRSNCILNHI